MPEVKLAPVEFTDARLSDLHLFPVHVSSGDPNCRRKHVCWTPPHLRYATHPDVPPAKEPPTGSLCCTIEICPLGRERYNVRPVYEFTKLLDWQEALKTVQIANTHETQVVNVRYRGRDGLDPIFSIAEIVSCPSTTGEKVTCADKQLKLFDVGKMLKDGHIVRVSAAKMGHRFDVHPENSFLATVSHREGEDVDAIFDGYVATERGYLHFLPAFSKMLITGTPADILNLTFQSPHLMRDVHLAAGKDLGAFSHALHNLQKGALSFQICVFGLDRVETVEMPNEALEQWIKDQEITPADVPFSAPRK